MSFKISGLCAATFTPFKSEGIAGTQVDVTLVDGHAAALARHGVKFAFINGTTGDSMSLSMSERKALAEAWVAAGKVHDVKIINHIGCNSIVESCELAAHAREIGCDAIAAMAPFFFKPTSAKSIAEWLATIAKAAPALPLYYYHFPAITGVTVDPLAIIKAVEEVGIESFRGFKFTDFNLWHFENCVSYRDGMYDIAYGRDEAALGGTATGAEGSIGNAFNFAAGLYTRIRASVAAGDLAAARKDQHRANHIVNMMNDAKYGGNGLVVSRAIFELKGVKLGPPRAPHVPLTKAQLDALREELERIEFFSWCD